jgi:hypothetical protein
MAGKVFRLEDSYAFNVTKILYITKILGSSLERGYWFEVRFINKDCIQTCANKNRELVAAERDFLIAKWEEAL